MPSSNFQRMLALASESFAAQNDPQQLDVNEEVIGQLAQLHPSTLSEYIDGDGPVIWVLLIPTTKALMNRFIQGEMGETELLNQTPVGSSYDALYLCSALTLPEYRERGLTKKLCLQAIRDVMKTNPIECLFVWNFSKEGDGLSRAVSAELQLPLMHRPR